MGEFETRSYGSEGHNARKLAFATLGGGDSPILNPSPVLELVVGWLEEELGQLAWLWRLPADWVEDEAGQLA